jgi:hypothetical protein
MSTTDRAIGASTETSLGYSVLRSIVTPYWKFTAVVMAFVAAGFALAPTVDWTVAGVALATIYVGLEGLHDIDLAHPDVAHRIDTNVQKAFGYTLTAIGVGLGALLAYMTTWTFLAFVAVGTVAGAAYNAEWLDGLFHDLDKYGLHNFGFSWAALPFVGGYYLMTETVTVGILLVGVAVAAYSAALLVEFEVSKVPVIYDDVGIEHGREYDLSAEDAAEQSARALNQIVLGSVFLAAGLVAHFHLAV